MELPQPQGQTGSGGSVVSKISGCGAAITRVLGEGGIGADTPIVGFRPLLRRVFIEHTRARHEKLLGVTL